MKCTRKTLTTSSIRSDDTCALRPPDTPRERTGDGLPATTGIHRRAADRVQSHLGSAVPPHGYPTFPPGQVSRAFRPAAQRRDQVRYLGRIDGQRGIAAKRSARIRQTSDHVRIPIATSRRKRRRGAARERSPCRHACSNSSGGTPSASLLATTSSQPARRSAIGRRSEQVPARVRASRATSLRRLDLVTTRNTGQRSRRVPR